VDHPPRIEDGQRVTVAGRTGSGKTTLACYLMERSPQTWVVMNPKHTAGYKFLPGIVVLNKYDEKQLKREMERAKYVALNLSGDQASAEYMDAITERLHHSFRNLGLCFDELYTAHTGSGKAGPGLTGWLTRGRELRQSFLGLTQRPVWVSRFCFSEADCIISMDLTLEADRRVLYEHTGQEPFLDRQLNHKWLSYDVSEDRLDLYGPVPVKGPAVNRTEPSSL
jgi:hypothetical protein